MVAGIVYFLCGGISSAFLLLVLYNYKKKLIIEKKLSLFAASDLLEKPLKFSIFREGIWGRIERTIDIAQREIEGKNKDLAIKSALIYSEEKKVKKLKHKLLSSLEKSASLSKSEAKKLLLELLVDETEYDAQKVIKKIEMQVNADSKQISANIITTVMQRYISEFVSIHSSGVIHLPSAEMKGRIIGKDGRNIKALEMATGVEFIIGESHEYITISAFNSTRREVAKRAINMLMEDGRINPGRIEAIVNMCKNNIEKDTMDHGNQIASEFNLRFHIEIIKLLGGLYFRSSYAQNVWEHSREVAYFAKAIASELGLDEVLAARCGLLHDIGKAIPQDSPGNHAEAGAKFAKMYNEDQIVVNAIASHHEDVPSTSVYGVITKIADAISACRPGARREALGAYIKRLERLEDLANNFDGVKKCYAFAAGREIRIIVDEHHIDDAHASILAKKIAKKIEDEINFPGQIKISVIRENRVVEYAR